MSFFYSETPLGEVDDEAVDALSGVVGGDEGREGSVGGVLGHGDPEGEGGAGARTGGGVLRGLGEVALEIGRGRWREALDPGHELGDRVRRR